MATSFGGGGGGAPDIKSILTNPWVIGAAAVALVIGIIVFRNTSKSAASTGATPVSGQLLGVQPGTAQSPETLSTAGLQQSLSTLTAQVSSGFAQLGGNKPGSPVQGSVIAGQEAGVDPGTFFGPPPNSIPSGDVLVWRWTSTYAAQHPELGSGYGVGNGPSPALGQPTPQNSWEWAVLPKGQVPGT